MPIEIIEATNNFTARGSRILVAKCSCGKLFTISEFKLNRGRVTSCGCLIKTPTYVSWANMLYRCYTPTCPQYAGYGGRGIRVCAQWRGRNGFKQFLKDMGERPDGRTLDRVYVNGNYTPNNCQWSTPKEQMRNRRNNKLDSVDVVSIRASNLSRKQLAAKYKVNVSTIQRVIVGTRWG